MSIASVSRLTLRTSWGPIIVTVRNAAVVACELPFRGADSASPPRLAGASLRVAHDRDRPTLRAAERFIRAVLRGKPSAPPALAQPKAGSFTAACWRQMRRIRPGAGVSYGELARRAGRPRAARAAGRACATNPLPLFVPCHRVTASNGRMGGFSAGPGWKAYLLKVESRP